jgi:hypothetical protein
MTWMYLFDADGNCFQKRQLLDEAWIDEIFQRSSASSYIVSEQDIQIDHARNENGTLIDVTPQPTVEAAWATVREKRDFLLIASDWTDTHSAPARLGEQVYEAWQAYRQALRDVTLQQDPLAIVWPEPPTK